jgi:hypothetical protein
MDIILCVLLSAAAFVGGVLMFKPAKAVCNGLDITKAANKVKAEKTINNWMGMLNRLKSFKTENAYLNIKAAQFIDDANGVFYRINADINCLYAADKFLDEYLAAGFSLIEKYDRADKAEESVSRGDFAETKQKIRENIERLIDSFHDNFGKLTDNDVRAIAEFSDLIKETANI